MLNIGGFPTGLLGLEELFAGLYREGWLPTDEKLNDALITGTRQHNFIPLPAVPEYASTLRMEYARFFRQKSSGKAVVARDYGSWRGYPREQIPWFPSIAPELCNDCGACLETCRP